MHRSKYFIKQKGTGIERCLIALRKLKLHSVVKMHIAGIAL